MYKTWTGEQEAILINLRKQGIKVSYISHKLKKSEWSIYNKLQEMNLVGKYEYWGELWAVAQQMKVQGKTYREIGLAIGKKPGTVKEKFMRENRKSRAKK